MEPAHCPSCGATSECMQVCVRAWHRLNAHFEGGHLVSGELGEVIDIDAEAESEVYCEACGWTGTEDDLSPVPVEERSER